ncbi:MAG: formylglycine-generating enzyme family protein [Nitrospina sp.]|nr:MAG: formylglycine-generating enzyme family protein [Nitrospina sp.]
MLSNYKARIRILFVSLFVLSACEGAPDPQPPKMVSEVDGKAMMLVPAGEFIMGTNRTDPENTHLKIGTVKPLYKDQHPERRVHLDAFYIDQYEVTNREYKKFVDDTQFHELPGHWEDGQFPKGKGGLPVTNVTWREALAYALWAGKRLPTEEQWEKAARGTDGRLFPWGNEYQKGWANVGVDGAKAPVTGGSFPKDVSPYNVYDMAGNAMEWTLSWYQAYPGNDYPFKKFGKQFKVLRGNGFQKGGHYFLEAYRYAFYRTEANPEEYFENVGFRCVRPVISRR